MQKPRAYIPLLLALTIVLSATASYSIASSQSANGKYDTDGDGLIEIQYLEQLDAIRYDLDGDGRSDDQRYVTAFPTSTGGSVCESDCNGYELTRSLDFDDEGSYASGAVLPAWTMGSGWLPIGVIDNRFYASFDGNGNTIGNLYINRTTTLDNPGVVGLFGSTGGHIQNIGIVDTDVTGYIDTTGLAGRNLGVGGLAGRNSGTITASYSSGVVSGNDYVGGLVGGNSGTITESHSSSIVFGDLFVGGLVGGNSYATIKFSYAVGNVTGRHWVGGLAGQNAFGTITSTYSTANVSGGNEVGGLVGGNSYATIKFSYAVGSVSGDEVVGGLAGSSGGTIIASYAAATVSGERDIGGLVGLGGGIDASYANSDVTGLTYIGGLVGRGGGAIRFSYSSSKVSGDKSFGGLIGLYEGEGTVVGSLWDTQSAAQRIGIGEGDDSGVEGKTTSQLKSPTDYTGIYAGWYIDLDNADEDFDPSTGADDLWDFGTSSQYPALKVDFNSDGLATWHEFGSQGRPLPTPTPPAAENADSHARPTAEVFMEVISANLLLGVWRYDNATASWAAYDPSVPAELNDLTSVAAKDIVWVGVSEEVQFQGITLNKGWNLITLK